MRIGLDARYLSHGLLGGVHTYVSNLVCELARLATDDCIFLYIDTKREFELEGQLPDNFVIRRLAWRNRLDSVKADFSIGKLAAYDRLDLLHFPANYGFGPPGMPTLITLHDALNIFPLWEAIKRDLKRPSTVAQTLYLQAMTRRSVSRASGLITVSRYSARHIEEVSRGKLPASGIDYVHSAPGPEFRPVTDKAVLEEARLRLKLPPHFVLADGLKNPGVILRAWARLPLQLQSRYELVFFSRRPDVLPVLQSALQRNQARLLLRPATHDLVALYNLAELFLFPSWIEGFGLPVLEAMACGAPVIASDRGSLPEIGGTAALYHDAEDDITLSNFLVSLLSSASMQTEFRERGWARAGQFSWAATARQIYEIYRRYARSTSTSKVQV